MLAAEVFDPTWWHISAIATEIGTTVEAVKEDILRGAYRSPLFKNGEWFVKREEVERSFFASLAPERFSAPVKKNARPSWARTDDWYDISIPPVRRYHGRNYLSFAEAARRLGTTYGKVYQRAKSGRYKTTRHLPHHRYIAESEVSWLMTQQQRNGRCA